MAITPQFLNLDDVPPRIARELALEFFQRDALEEPYWQTLRRTRKNVWSCPNEKHLWMRPERGPWVCTRCPEERWTL